MDNLPVVTSIAIQCSLSASLSLSFFSSALYWFRYWIFIKYRKWTLRERKEESYYVIYSKLDLLSIPRSKPYLSFVQVKRSFKRSERSSKPYLFQYRKEYQLSSVLLTHCPSVRYFIWTLSSWSAVFIWMYLSIELGESIYGLWIFPNLQCWYRRREYSDRVLSQDVLLSFKSRTKSFQYFQTK